MLDRLCRPVQRSRSNRILLVQEHIIQQSYSAFRNNGIRKLESVVYWYGVESQDLNEDIVMAVAVPNATCHSTHYEVSEDEAATMGRNMMKKSLVCLAQFHTHPGKHTEHSFYDDWNSLSHRNGFLSLVAPNYGCDKDPCLDDVTVHEVWDHRWYRLTRDSKRRRLRIIKDITD